MFLPWLVKFLLALVLISDRTHSEDIPYQEYDVGIVLSTLQRAIANTIDYYTHGGFALDKEVTFHCHTP